MDDVLKDKMKIISFLPQIRYPELSRMSRKPPLDGEEPEGLLLG